MATTLELRGPAGEPVDFRRTLASHGVATLPPNRIDEENWTLQRGDLRVSERSPGYVSVEPAGAVAVVRRMLNLDEDLSGLYALAADDPELAWITRGAGRMLRSPTVFEDVVKPTSRDSTAASSRARRASFMRALRSLRFFAASSSGTSTTSRRRGAAVERGARSWRAEERWL